MGKGQAPEARGLETLWRGEGVERGAGLRSSDLPAWCRGLLAMEEVLSP